MKSLHIYLREPVKTPSRVVSDYTADELAAMAQRIAPVASRYRRLHSASFWLPFGVVFLIIFGQWLPSAFWPWLWALGIGGLLASLVTWALAKRCVCPGCANKVASSVGHYCPECGAPGVERGRLLRAPSCASCQRQLGFSRRNRFLFRFCSHCGLKLDQEGLSR